MGGVSSTAHAAAAAEVEARVADKLGEIKMFKKRFTGQRATVTDKHGKLQRKKREHVSMSSLGL
jgi:hypothetical protein